MNSTGKKILIVEDELPIVRVLTDKLTAEGFQVFEATNGIIGLEKAQHDNPDLILLDIIMPEMDGITMLKKLRLTEKGKLMPIILLTNLSDANEFQEAVDSGVTDYLIKTDWKLEDVIQLIKKKLQVDSQ